MIPALVSGSHIDRAIRRIHRTGIPSRRKSRGYCLVTDRGHLPPKYTIALAHKIATGRFLSSDRFGGGTESNGFLERLGFRVDECSCGGTVRGNRGAPETAKPKRSRRTISGKRHTERCPECKNRVREMLERIYGTCLRDQSFGWPTGADAYDGTAIGDTLREVAAVLESYRGFGIADFIRKKTLAPCDFWVPDPGFVVEFDESQHFTRPRKLALEVYADEPLIGFSAKRWMDLCEQRNAKDNDPPFRDEQRAWYDTLRDLVPTTKGLLPTVRLHAGDLPWCSLDPADRDDRERFSRLIRHQKSPAGPRASGIREAPGPSASTLRVAMVFPETNRKSSNGVPPDAAGAPKPCVPTPDAFAGEAVDFVIFPEGYIGASDRGSTESLKKLACGLDAPLVVGAIDNGFDASGRTWQVLLRFDPDGSGPSRIYTKHSTAEAVAFERSDWEARTTLPTFELSGAMAGATVCHDAYLGLLPRYLARAGARIWINPSFDNVTEVKWSSVHRLRAVENRIFSLCTLHCDRNRRSTHPFGYSPDGRELPAREAGTGIVRPLSECTEPGRIYVVDLDMDAAGNALEWSKLPPADKPRRPRRGEARRPVRVSVNSAQPAVFGRKGWKPLRSGCLVETDSGPVYAQPVPEARILDAGACFRVIDRAKQMNAAPVIWNHWARLPTGSDRLAMLLMGRAIECCAPVLISDSGGIRELVELANRNKIPVRRDIEPSGQAIVDIGYAWGLDSAFKMVAARLPAHMREKALDRYRSLG